MRTAGDGPRNGEAALGHARTRARMLHPSNVGVQARKQGRAHHGAIAHARVVRARLRAREAPTGQEAGALKRSDKLRTQVVHSVQRRQRQKALCYHRNARSRHAAGSEATRRARARSSWGRMRHGSREAANLVGKLAFLASTPATRNDRAPRGVCGVPSQEIRLLPGKPLLGPA